MKAITDFFEKYPLTTHIIFKGLEASLIVFSATLFYVVNAYLRFDIMNYHPFLKKYYISIALITHMLLVFISVVIIIYTFQYGFGVTL